MIVTIQYILKVYEEDLGQKINYQKSCIHYSVNIDAASRAVLQAILGMEEACPIDAYLGVPTAIGWSKHELFCLIKERV